MTHRCMNKSVLEAIYKPLHRESLLICNPSGFFDRSSSTLVKSLHVDLFLIQVFSHTFCLLKANS